MDSHINLQQAVIESMKEGVLAVDTEGRILLLNKTAEDLIGLSEETSKGEKLSDTISNKDIVNFFQTILIEKTSRVLEIVFNGNDSEKDVQINGSILYDSNNVEIGALGVFNDITTLKQLDNLKKDFVANVSHELKTPITSIKGFVETLREGNFEDGETTKKFLKIISRNAERLNAIIEDLLMLSRLEQENFQDKLQLDNVNIRSVIEAALSGFEFKAKEKNIIVEIECEDNLTLNINNSLIENALENLIDNAIKYSGQNCKVLIKTSYEGDNFVLSVQDEAGGIPAENIPRLFERFYRVDKARSRDAGGTGLGLAIVKHIAQVHRGFAQVKSELGKGSTFSIVIPKILST